jgi:hypothetical protein
MILLLQIVTVSISALSLYALADIARSVRELLNTDIPKNRAIRTVSMTGKQFSLPSHGGDAVWVYRKGSWSLSDEGNCQPGYEPGTPPKFQGEFDGHTVRRPCRRRPMARV